MPGSQFKHASHGRNVICVCFHLIFVGMFLLLIFLKIIWHTVYGLKAYAFQLAEIIDPI